MVPGWDFRILEIWMLFLGATAGSGPIMIERYLPLEDQAVYFNPGFRFRMIK